MHDPYLYSDVLVLQNKLRIRTEKTLDLIEAEQSRTNMMLLYERGFSDFSPVGFARSTVSFLEIFMIGLENTASSIFKSPSGCWPDRVCGTPMMTILSETWTRLLLKSMRSTGTAAPARSL